MKLKSANALVASSLTLLAASFALAQSHPTGPTTGRPPVTAIPVQHPGAGTAHAGQAPSAPTAATPIPAGGGAGGGAGGSGGTSAGSAGGTGAGFGGPGHGPPTSVTQAAGGTGVHEFESGIDYTPLPPGARITFNLQDADLPDLIRAIGNITGKRFILPGKVRSIKTTIYSPTKVTPGEAYQAFLSTLEANGLTVVPAGRYLKITETGGIVTDSIPTYAPGEGSPANDGFVTRIHRLHNMSADDAASVLGHFGSHDGNITPYAATNTIVVTDTGSNIRRMLQILSEIDVPAVGEQIWIERLHYASAQDLSQRITDILGGGSGGGGGGAGGGGGGGHAAGGGTGDARLTRIMPDERSNSLIIVATERMYLRVLELIRRLDVPIQNGEGDIQVYYLQHADAEELSNTLNQITGGGGHPAGGAPAPPSGGAAGQHALGIFEGPVRVSPDKRTNSLIITSSPRDFAGLRRVITELDHARRQVFIEAVVMELSVNNQSKLGVSWHGPVPPVNIGGAGDSLGIFGFNQSPTNNPSSVLFPGSLLGAQDALQGAVFGIRGPYLPGTQNLIPGLTLGIPAFGAVIDALAQSGDADVLATPSIIALDNEPADINVGQDIPLQTNVGGIPSLGGAAGTPGAIPGLGFGLGGFSAPRTKVGTKIHIVPHINESNEVRMDIEEEVSEAGDPTGALGVVPINLRTAKTKMVVQDQQTVVIGGLVRNSVRRGTTRIPVLGDLPLIGFLFRTEQRTVERRNLLLFLTPYVIRDQSDLRRIFERKMRERQEFLDRYFVFAESSEYRPHIDYTRTNGLVEEIREAIRELREQAEIEARAMPPPAPPHSATEPIELPSEARPAASGGAAGAGPPAEGNPDGAEPQESAAPRPPGALIRPSVLTAPRPVAIPPPQ